MSICPVDTISILRVIKISSNCALVHSHICIECIAIGIFFFYLEKQVMQLQDLK